MTDDDKGTYVCAFFDKETVENLQRFIEDAKVSTRYRHIQLHSTILYSKKCCPNYSSPGLYDQPITGVPLGLAVWRSETNGTNCLVLLYDAPGLEQRHKKLMEEHQATYDFPTYQPHVTLSYDCGDLDLATLPNIMNYVQTLTIIREYGKKLDLPEFNSRYSVSQ